MDNLILRITDILIFAGFAYSGLRLIERIAGTKRYSALVFIMIGLIAGVAESAMVYLPISISYLISFVLLYMAILFLFHISGINNIYGTLAILNSAMCLRGIFGSILAMVLRAPVYDVFNTIQYNLVVSCAADFVCLVIVLSTSKSISPERILLSLKPRAGRSLLTGWMIGTALLSVINAVIFEFEVDHLAFTLLEGNYCFALLVSCYALLLFTFRMNKDDDTTNNLSSELLAQNRLQSALVRDALFIAQANVSSNRIIDGLGVYSENITKDNVTYDQWLDFAATKIHPEDYACFRSVINRKNLLNCFERGIEPDPIRYRRLYDDGEYRWVKISIRLYSDTTTNDVHIVGYAMDVDKDMREKAELEKRARTDSLTKLLNRETAEKAIAAEIQKGCGALFLMDIDDFKDVNDCMGHESGDKVLINAANRLKKFFGDDGIVGRLGGDEFLAYLKDINDEDALSARAGRLIDFLSQPPEAPDEPTISFSLGVAPVRESGLSFTTVYSQADSALYEKKYNGKHGFLIYSK